MVRQVIILIKAIGRSDFEHLSGVERELVGRSRNGDKSHRSFSARQETCLGWVC